LEKLSFCWYWQALWHWLSGLCGSHANPAEAATATAGTAAAVTKNFKSARSGCFTPKETMACGSVQSLAISASAVDQKAPSDELIAKTAAALK
jgi:hypothetical protein